MPDFDDLPPIQRDAIEDRIYDDMTPWREAGGGGEEKTSDAQYSAEVNRLRAKYANAPEEQRLAMVEQYKAEGGKEPDQGPFDVRGALKEENDLLIKKIEDTPVSDRLYLRDRPWEDMSITDSDLNNALGVYKAYYFDGADIKVVGKPSKEPGLGV